MLVSGFLVLWAGVAIAAEGRDLTLALKAAYLYNFTKFVEWPADREGGPRDSLEICVVGLNPFGTRLNDAVDKRTVRGHPLRVRDLAPPIDASSCHVVYIPKSEAKRVEAVLSQVPAVGVLTVSDIPGFLELGGKIELITVDNRMTFRVNLQLAKEAGLAVSSRLLALAAEVISHKQATD